MFNQITDFNNVLDAYYKTQKGKSKHKHSAILFAQNPLYNIKFLINELQTQAYNPSEYNEFYVYEPKERLIYAPAYRDKIVHHAVNNILRPIFEKCFIKDSYACITGKGNTRAVLAIQKYQSKFRKGYFVKVDIYKFFYSIDHQILKNILRKKIKCHTTMHLLETLINSSPTPGVGLPLGNLSSQLFANIYMNQLDQFAKRGLGVKAYVRYADDIFIFVENKSKALSVQSLIIQFLKNKLKLTVARSKTFIHPAKNYVSALGFRIKPTHILLLSKNKRRIVKRCKMLVKYTKSIWQKMAASRSLTSWYSFARLASSFKFVGHLCKRFNLVQHENKLFIGDSYA